MYIYIYAYIEMLVFSSLSCYLFVKEKNEEEEEEEEEKKKEKKTTRWREKKKYFLYCLLIAIVELNIDNSILRFLK